MARCAEDLRTRCTRINLIGNLRVVRFERITIDPEQMGGLPCIRGMRVTVSAVVGQLATGRSIDEVLADYPYLERLDVLAALEYAAAAVSERELPLPA